MSLKITRCLDDFELNHEFTIGADLKPGYRCFHCQEVVGAGEDHRHD